MILLQVPLKPIVGKSFLTANKKGFHANLGYGNLDIWVWMYIVYCVRSNKEAGMFLTMVLEGAGNVFLNATVVFVLFEKLRVLHCTGST